MENNAIKSLVQYLSTDAALLAELTLEAYCQLDLTVSYKPWKTKRTFRLT